MNVQKHPLHDELAAHITQWAGARGVTFNDADLHEVLGSAHVRGALDDAQRGNVQDTAKLDQSLAAVGGMSDFMLSKGATHPRVAATVQAVETLLRS